MLTRRQVVGGLVSLAVLGRRSWTASAAPPRHPHGGVTLHGHFSKAGFHQLLGESFAISTGNDVVWLQLIQIDDGPVSPVTEQFSLVFRGPQDPVLPAGPHILDHHAAGRTTLYLQFGGYDQQHCYYEAPFNLLL